MSYSPPVVSRELGRNAYAARNTFSKYAPYCDQIDGISVEALIKQYGSPLFVFSERIIRETVQRAKRAFRDAYSGRTEFAWSIKSNSLNAICNLYRDEGSLGEVVSEFELEKALKIWPGQEVIFNGPAKSRAGLEAALRLGVLVQIDNWDELEMVEALVENIDRPCRIGLRTWMDNPHVPGVWSKFGFHLDGGEAMRVALRITANSQLRLHTLHSHIGTQVLEPRAYGVAAKKLAELRHELHLATDWLVPCINVGGGFPSSNLWHGEPDETKHPLIEEYAREIGRVFNKIDKPLLRLETGRHLVDDAGYLITSVATVKGMEHTEDKPVRGKASRGGYVLDVGVGLLPLVQWYKPRVMPAKKALPTELNTAKLYGPLCMNIDVLREAIELPPLDVGDLLMVHPVGAYNQGQGMAWIQLRPAAVMISDGRARIIRHREQLADVESLESP